jgi:hypothetical protein
MPQNREDFMDDELNRHIVEMQNSRASKGERALPLKPLRIPPKYGVYLWWPVDQNWVHPDDLETANELIPSNRVFRREEYDSEYSLLLYGEQFIRVRPVLWLEIHSEGYELGDQVEVKSQMGKGQPLVATIDDIRWDKESREIKYSLSSYGRAVERSYSSDEFQLTHQLDTVLDERRLRLLERARFS